MLSNSLHFQEAASKEYSGTFPVQSADAHTLTQRCGQSYPTHTQCHKVLMCVDSYQVHYKQKIHMRDSEG